MASRLSLRKLSGFSRRLATMLEAGIPVRRALNTMEKGAWGAERKMYARLGKDIEDGCTFTEALARQEGAFPLFFLRLVQVGETVGMLGRVLTRLADYYDAVRDMWARFIGRMIYPVFQYWALILVLSLVAYIMGMLGQRPTGQRDAVRIFLIGVALFVTPFLGYFIITRVMGASRVLYEVALRIPAVGYAMRSMALARFSWSMALMTDAGVNIIDALRWSLQSTSNAAFEARTDGIIALLKDGEPVSRALDQTKLFPLEYIEMVHTGEESGKMPEMFDRMAKIYFEKADQAIRAMVAAIGWLVWAAVAAVIVFYIFTFAVSYMNQIGQLTQGT
jgi:type II secretory pathway component PulF